MKDSLARGDIEGLKASLDRLRERVGYGTVGESSLIVQINKLHNRLSALEAQNYLVEKQCPVCGHVTLMKKQGALVQYDPVASNDGSLVARYNTVRPEGFYCFGCGKSYKETSRTELEEMGG